MHLLARHSLVHVFWLVTRLVKVLFPHSQLGQPKPLALSDSGLGVRVSIPIALPPPGMRNEALHSDLAVAPPVVMTRVLVFEKEVGGRPGA